jgi:Fe-S cluster biogenesis protein NfuA
VAVVVLEEQVNPSIASHGGRADLVAMDEEKKVAYIKLSGGCQGCAMSRLTLSQGIETMLRESIPELDWCARRHRSRLGRESLLRARSKAPPRRH